jgi:hypothetical protein
MRSLESITTRELELLASACSRAGGSLTDLERAAILKGIEAELRDRAAAQKSGYLQVTEADRIQALLEDKEEEILMNAIMLDDELGAAESKPEAKPGAESRQEGECR